MSIYTVDAAVFLSPAAEYYYANADRRILTGLRYALDTLGIPLPPYATRKPAGANPGRAIREAYEADHPTPRSTVLAPRKPTATYSNPKA